MSRFSTAKTLFDKDNDRKLVSLSFLFFLPVCLDFITVLTEGNSSIYTYVLYISSLIIILYGNKHCINLKNIVRLFLVYGIFGLSFLLFPKTRIYYQTDGFLILVVYFLPIVMLVISSIKRWTNFFYIMSFFGYLAIIAGIYIVFFSSATLYGQDDALFTYMEFSYAQLPFVCSLFANYTINKRWYSLAFALIGLVEILAFGSRAALLLALSFILILQLINSKQSKVAILMFSVFALILYVNLESIVQSLLRIPYFQDSYILRHLIAGELFEHDTRKEIYADCIQRIYTMGLDISGFFGDRLYISVVYPHHIVYEILMQMGWLLGSLFMFWLLLLIIRSFKKVNNRAIVAFLVCCLFGRYFFSGSYIVEGKFWIFLGCLFALNNKYYYC